MGSSGSRAAAPSLPSASPCPVTCHATELTVGGGGLLDVNQATELTVGADLEGVWRGSTRCKQATELMVGGGLEGV
eukprot:173722-Prorocentrum_minimum.AAC.2